MIGVCGIVFISWVLYQVVKVSKLSEKAVIAMLVSLWLSLAFSIAFFEF